MGEMDTDTFGLVTLIAAVLAVLIAGKLQARKAKRDATRTEDHPWSNAAVRLSPAAGLLRRL
jgi:hypothetical protein